MATKAKYYIGGAVALTLMIVLSMSLINVKNAYHLDENYKNLGKVTDFVTHQDDSWVNIPNGHYLRIQFERKLTSSNDILIYAQGAGNISVYKKGGKTKIAEFQNIDNSGFYEVLLKYMTGAATDTFDLKSEGNIYYDYVTDPGAGFNVTQVQPTDTVIVTSNITQNFTFNINLGTEGLSQIKYSWNYLNYSSADYRTKGICNMNNFSALGENNTYLNCWNMNGGFNMNCSDLYNCPTFSSNGGRNSGGFAFDGSQYMKNNVASMNTTSGTLCAWEKTNSFDIGASVISMGTDFSNYLRIVVVSSSTPMSLWFYNDAGVEDCRVYYPSTLELGTWHRVCGTYNLVDGGNCTLYVDGAGYTDTSVDGSHYNLTDLTNAPITIGAKPLTGDYFNGAEDDVRIENWSFSAEDALQDYYSTRIKYNSTFYQENWSQVLSVVTTPYYLCASNSTGTEVCTTNNTVRNFEMLSVNFSNTKGIVRSDLFCATTHTANPLVTDSQVDWFRSAWNNASMGGQRIDQNLGDFFGGPYNFDFEQWLNTSMIFKSTNTLQQAAGWESYPQYGNGTVQRVTDAHGGNYAIEVNMSGTGSLYLDRGEGTGDILYSNNTVYNVSVWMKGQGTATLSVQDRDNAFNQVVLGNVTLNSTWQFVSGSWNTSGGAIKMSTNTSTTRYRVVIGGGAYSNLTVDDFNMSKDTSLLEQYWISNQSKISEWQTQFAYNLLIGNKVVVITSYMPDFIANFSSGYCKTSASSCPSTNYDLFGRLNKYWFDLVTDNGTKYTNQLLDEMSNEPEIDFFCNNLSTDDSRKSEEYVKMYNATEFYMNISYPSIPFGGPTLSGNTCNNPYGYKLINNTLGNFSNGRMDFFSGHCYQYPLYNYVKSGTDSFYRLCSDLGVTCPKSIYWDEINIANFGEGLFVVNTSSYDSSFKSNIMGIYQDAINYYPSNISMCIYQWTANRVYFPSNYTDGGDLLDMVSSPSYDNKFYATYNITKEVSHLCPPGAISKEAKQSNNAEITSCIYNGRYAIILNKITIGTENYSVNLSLDNGTILYPHDKIINYRTGEIINVTGGTFLVGLSSLYNITELVSESVNISLGTGITTIKFTPQNKTQQNLWATGQTASKGLFNITNTGLFPMNLSIKVNSTKAGWSMECNNATSEPWIVLNDSYKVLYTNLLPGGNFQVWCRTDLSNPTSSWSGKVYFQY